MTSCEQHILALGNSILQAKGWDGKTRAIMLAGKHLDILPESARTESNFVSGCDSHVWVDLAPQDIPQVVLAYSPSKIIRGVLAVLLEKANSLTKTERRGFDFQQYLVNCQLERHLSQSRGNGIKNVIHRLTSL